jgi:hypothetical protein
MVGQEIAQQVYPLTTRLPCRGIQHGQKLSASALPKGYSLLGQSLSSRPWGGSQAFPKHCFSDDLDNVTTFQCSIG